MPFFKYFVKIRRLLLYILLGIVLYFVNNGCIENANIKNRVNEFISTTTFQYEIDNTRYYSVSRETLNEDRPTRVNGYLGVPGDILITKTAPIDLAGLSQTLDFFFGGHAAIVTSSIKNDDGTYGNVGDRVIETVGNSGSNDGVRQVSNSWGRGYNETEDIIGVRVKNFSDSDYYDVLSYAEQEIGKNYNYSFVFNTKNSYYCTDYVARMFEKKNVQLNDGFITSTNDIILSENVYIFYYQYVDEFGIKHIYYID